MSRLRSAAVTGALLLSALPATVVGAAHADASRPHDRASTPCMTKAEYGRVPKGMRRWKVVQIAGSKGTPLGDWWGSDGEWETWAWRHCGTSKHYVISFRWSSRPQGQWPVVDKDVTGAL